jgi:hypothetical protein
MLEHARYKSDRLQLDGNSVFKHPDAENIFSRFLIARETYGDGAKMDSETKKAYTEAARVVAASVLNHCSCFVTSCNVGLERIVRNSTNVGFTVTEEASRVSDGDKFPLLSKFTLRVDSEGREDMGLVWALSMGWHLVDS